MEIESAIRNHSFYLVANSNIAIPFVKNLREQITAIIPTRSPDAQFLDVCKSLTLEVLEQDILFSITNSLVILFECHKIIPRAVFSKGLWLNIHSGLLPKWRGYSANSWALLNKEPKLGFTIHELEEEFDAGRIIDYVTIDNTPSSNYFDLRQELLYKLINRIPSLTYEYVNGLSVPPKSLYEHDDIRYCAKLRKSDGIISDFSYLTDWLINLGRLYINKSGSQLFFSLNGKLIRIENLKEESGSYQGFHSRILKVSDNWVLFKTLDSAIWCQFEDSTRVVNEIRKSSTIIKRNE